MRKFLVLVILPLLASCSTLETHAPVIEPNPKFDKKVEHKRPERGRASYYGERFHGKKTASGARFDKNAMTAAHKSLPMGTTVQVRDVITNQTVIVKITDRGPHIKGRIIDLSEEAAKRLGMKHDGILEVEIEPIVDSSSGSAQ